MRLITAMMSVAFLFGCATPQPRTFPPPTDYVPLNQVQIKSRYEHITLTRENLVAEAIKCVPALTPTSQNFTRPLREFPSPGYTIGFAHLSSSKKFFQRETKGFCLEYSANQYPIFALETFFRTANPNGVPPDITDQWFTTVAKKIASHGRVKVAFSSGKGVGFIVTYWVDGPGPFALNYSSEMKKAGEWETTEVDYRFSHPSFVNVSVTKRGSAMLTVKSFPWRDG